GRFRTAFLGRSSDRPVRHRTRRYTGSRVARAHADAALRSGVALSRQGGEGRAVLPEAEWWAASARGLRRRGCDAQGNRAALIQAKNRGGAGAVAGGGSDRLQRHLRVRE